MLDRTGSPAFVDWDAGTMPPQAQTGSEGVGFSSFSGRTGPVRLGRVVVYRDVAPALEIWERLELSAAVSAYQTRRWLVPWLETTGRASGVSPFIIVAFDKAGQPLALLPFGIWRQGLLTVAGFLGGRDSNFNLGLFRPGPAWTPATLLKLLHSAARVEGSKVELFVLHNQPHQWEGVTNPLLLLPHQPSPSFGYKVALSDDADEFIKRNLSGDNRKKLRKKMARLQALAPVRHGVARSAEEGRAILDAFIAQRLSRCTALGLGASDLPDLRAFLERCSIVGSDKPPVELHALYCGERIIATFGGTSHRNRYCGMVMSFDADPDIARSSPGEILLESLIRSKCAEGLSLFDLGIGEARYKEIYCPEAEPLFDSIVTLSARAKVFAMAESVRLRTKRRIKQSAWAWAMVRALRKAMRRCGA